MIVQTRRTLFFSALILLSHVLVSQTIFRAIEAPPR